MKLISDYNKAFSNIINEMKTYLIDNDLKAMIVGVSGGIDSALTTALAHFVRKEIGVKVIARSITIESNKQDEIDRARRVGEAFADDFREVDLTEAYRAFLPKIVEDFNSQQENLKFKIRKGNIKARMRMIYLYDIAAKNSGLVLSTDNYTELLLGFWTLHGDVGDFGPIQQLWKTEVYELARYIAENKVENAQQSEALRKCIEAVPTDGLGITNSDLDQLGAASYKEVDQILMKYLYEGDKSLEKHPVIQRHLATTFKRNNPYNISRDKILK